MLAYRASGACAVHAEFSYSGAAATINIAPGVGWVSATIASTEVAGLSGELVLTVQGSPSFCDIQYVGIFEEPSTAASLALPSGESVPTTFAPNADERMGSGRVILADDLAQMIRNTVWLWAYRGDRILVSDCRFTYQENTGSAFSGVLSSADVAAVHAFKASRRNTGDSLGEIQIRAGWHSGSGSQSPASWEAWRFKVRMEGTSDLAGAPEKGAEEQARAFPNADWDTHGMAAWQHARGATVGSEATVAFDTMMMTAGHSTGIYKSTRPSWLVVEEMPLGTPAKAYP
jgi:hypothetical protein